jgi:hypothetical protein
MSRARLLLRSMLESLPLAPDDDVIGARASKAAEVRERHAAVAVPVAVAANGEKRCRPNAEGRRGTGALQSLALRRPSFAAIRRWGRGPGVPLFVGIPCALVAVHAARDALWGVWPFGVVAGTLKSSPPPPPPWPYWTHPPAVALGCRACGGSRPGGRRRRVRYGRRPSAFRRRPPQAPRAMLVDVLSCFRPLWANERLRHLRSSIAPRRLANVIDVHAVPARSRLA